MTLTAYDKVIRAKVQLQTMKPFFSYLLMYMRCHEEPNCPSMAVDKAGNLYYNPEWIDKLKKGETEGVLVHEALHIALQHIGRGNSRDMKLFNVANDLVINDMLCVEGFKLPDGLIPDYKHEFVFDSNFKLEKINEKTSEQIYDELYREAKKRGRGKGNKQGQGDGDGFADGLDSKRFDEHRQGGKDKNGNELTEAEAKEIEKGWKRVLAEAVEYAKQRGMMPAGMERLVDGILESKVSWRHKLYRFITNELPYDYSWSKPHKKSISTGVYMPSVTREMIEMLVSIDTSGSIGQAELTEFLTEICTIAKSFSNVRMTLLVCDCEIHNEYEVANGNIDTILKLKIGGGGGTSHKPIVDYVLDRSKPTKVLIALTDGYSDIESQFNRLPDNCHKIIVLAQNGKTEQSMEQYGEVVKL